ncbi:MAG: hypothetical protein UZ22_OP11002000233 [Microgenomates bacterium OLB23]|nr:MAG: hypothetical protein UZ22_OP11002000233 [Microgenomates bacterium OLB23]
MQPHLDVTGTSRERRNIVTATTVTYDSGGNDPAIKKLVLVLMAFGPLALAPWVVYWGISAGLLVWWIDIPLIVFFNEWRGLGVTLGFHRTLTHATYQAKAAWNEGGFALHPWVRMFFLIGGHLAIQTDGEGWGWLHRRHHSDSDGPHDPHTPWRYVDEDQLKPGMPGYKWALLKGIAWAHFGWMLRSWAPEERFYKGFAEDKQLQWCRRHYGKLILFSYLGPLCIAAVLKVLLLGGSEWNTERLVASVLFSGLCAGVLNIAFVHHITWCVNSLCHTFGVRPFQKVGSDRSTDLPLWEYGPLGKAAALWFAFTSNGEAYHAGHHAFAGSPKHALAWKWHLDITWYLIRLLAYLNLAHVSGVPSNEQIRRRLVPSWKPPE